MFTLFSSISRLKLQRKQGKGLLLETVYTDDSKKIRRQKSRGDPQETDAVTLKTLVWGNLVQANGPVQPKHIPREQRTITATHGDDSGHQEKMNLCSNEKER